MLHDVNSKLVTVELIHNGNVLTKYAHEGQNYIQAPVTGNYSIRLRNNHWQRVLVVVSVDGRNIIDGDEAGYDGSGYVLQPYQSYDISGWRRTSDEVAAFEFVDIQSSYDKQMGGSGSNVGVIGAAVFTEKQKYHLRQGGSTFWNTIEEVKYGAIGNGALGNTKVYPSGVIGNNYCYESSMPTITPLIITECSVASSSTMDTAESPVQLGTGYGQKQAMKTRDTVFEREAQLPFQVITLRYASQSMLKKWGVISSTPANPNPFPKQQVSCQAPPNWKG